jgi:carboxypeptidase C (cathepsin A)
MLSKIVVALSLLSVGADYTPDAEADRITDLPGAPDVDYGMFSGYLKVDEANDVNYFYWFAECDGCDSTTSPVALWTNGGPGCSGLLGFLTEQGPLRPQEDGTLVQNPYAWNKAANYLFIEQPVGVGFSYSTTRSAYNDVGDDDAAELNYQLVVKFFERFPQYADNDFYISAESYGGHYMPTLAKYIVDNNADGAINFKGFAVGNPYTDPVENAIGSIDTLYGHSMVPHPTYEKWLKLCRNGEDPLSSVCQLLQAQMSFNQIGDVNPYALDYPVCLADGKMKLTRYQARIAYSILSPAVQQALGLPGDPTDYDPCVPDYAQTYLDRDDVKVALHANTNITWLECSGRTSYGTLKYNYSWSDVPMEPYYQYLLESDADLKIMVFSGDDDSICGTVGTQSWIYDLGYDTTDDWTSWIDIDGQVAGYVQKFESKLTFATVHGAGHEVPEYKPAQALQLIQAYFNSSDWLF